MWPLRSDRDLRPGCDRDPASAAPAIGDLEDGGAGSNSRVEDLLSSDPQGGQGCSLVEVGAEGFGVAARQDRLRLDEGNPGTGACSLDGVEEMDGGDVGIRPEEVGSFRPALSGESWHGAPLQRTGERWVPGHQQRAGPRLWPPGQGVGAANVDGGRCEMVDVRPGGSQLGPEPELNRPSADLDCHRVDVDAGDPVDRSLRFDVEFDEAVQTGEEERSAATGRVDELIRASAVRGGEANDPCDHGLRRVPGAPGFPVDRRRRLFVNEADEPRIGPPVGWDRPIMGRRCQGSAATSGRIRSRRDERRDRRNVERFSDPVGDERGERSRWKIWVTAADAARPLLHRLAAPYTTVLRTGGP
jgi:hypothetical protein